jgi:hypothetical protein
MVGLLRGSKIWMQLPTTAQYGDRLLLLPIPTVDTMSYLVFRLHCSRMINYALNFLITMYTKI